MHLVDWHIISTPYEYGDWNIKNLEWFGMSLILKSLWMVLNGRGLWSHIIAHKYLKNISVDEWIHTQHFPVHGTSFFWKGFIRSLSWITSQLWWKVGNGLRIRLGINRIAGLNTPFVLSECLREYLYGFGITHLFQAQNLDYGPNYQEYWYTAANLNLGGVWEEQWT